MYEETSPSSQQTREAKNRYDDDEMALYCREVLPPPDYIASTSSSSTRKSTAAMIMEATDPEEALLYCHERLPNILSPTLNRHYSSIDSLKVEEQHQKQISFTKEEEQRRGDIEMSSVEHEPSNPFCNSSVVKIYCPNSQQQQNHKAVVQPKKKETNEFHHIHLLTAALSVVESRCTHFIEGERQMSNNNNNKDIYGSVINDEQNIMPEGAIISSSDSSSSTNGFFSESPSSPSSSYTTSPSNISPVTAPLMSSASSASHGEPKKKNIPWQHKRQNVLNKFDQKSNSTNLSHPPPKGLSNPLFPQKVFEMITEKSKTHPDIINFSDDGKAFSIAEKSPQLGPILQEYFYHGNYPSLQRQLNMYGFRKVTSGLYKGLFYHPRLHRSSTLLDLNAIERKCRPKCGFGSSCSSTSSVSRMKKKNYSNNISKTRMTSTKKKKIQVHDDSWEQMFDLWCQYQKEKEETKEEVEEKLEESESIKKMEHCNAMNNRRMTTRGCKQKLEQQRRKRQGKQQLCPPQLSRWIKKQCILYKDLKQVRGQQESSSILTCDRINRLNSVGFIWEK